MFIDSHFHFDHRAPDLETMFQRLQEAQAQGVTKGVLVVSTATDWQRASIVRQHFPWVDLAFGFHPNDNPHITEAEWEQLYEVASRREVVAIGEIGLDYHYDHDRNLQIEIFRRQMDIALATGVPVVLHCREAFTDLLAILAEYPTVTKVFHCFSGGVEEAKQAVALGAYLSFSGTVTFPKNQTLQSAFLATPLSRCLVETDSPFLTPVPLRGKVNEPQYVLHTYRFLAQLRGISIEELAEMVGNNYRMVFGK